MFGVESVFVHFVKNGRIMVKRIFVVLALILSLSSRSWAAEPSDCASRCEDGGRKALELCKANHPNDPGYCPRDDGHMREDCVKLCADLENKSPEELQKMLPPNYKDMLEGK
jgi:hypothetical protein